MDVHWFLSILLAMSSSPMCSAETPSCTLDLGLVVDLTKSIKARNIPDLEASLIDLVSRFDVSTDGTHVSFETFAGQANLRNMFNDVQYQSNQAITELISTTIDPSNLNSPTRLDRALSTANASMFTAESGKRLGEMSALVLYTDGRSHPNTEDFMPDVMSLKMKGVRFVCVGIGPDAQNPVYQAVLESICGDDVFYVEDYSLLEQATDDIVGLICPPSPCVNSTGLDIAFLVDRTKSIGMEDFMLLKGFLLSITSGLDIGPDMTHTGFITFAKYPTVINTFADDQYYSNEAVAQLINDIPNILGSRTFIDRALIAANISLFTLAGGDRPNNPNVLILWTDGRTNSASIPYSEIIPSLVDKGVDRIAVGIGNYENFIDDLYEIAGENNTYTADNFEELSDLFDEILEAACTVDGGFTRWSLYSECSVTCGVGVETRTRTCTNPPPQGSGSPCEGPTEETRPCTEPPCPNVEV